MAEPVSKMPPKTRPTNKDKKDNISCDLQQITKPDDVPQALWDIIMAIKEDTGDVKNCLMKLETRISGLEEDYDNVNRKVHHLEQRMTALEAKLIRTETVNQRLHSEITHLKLHSMKQNIIFSFDPDCKDLKEVQGEDTVGKVKHFLKTVLNISQAETFTIPVAFRLGAYKPNISRQILAQFPISSEFQLVMKHSNRLRDTKHFLNKQLPPEQRERLQFVQPIYKVKKQQPHTKTKLVNDRLYINDKLQDKYLAPSLPVIDNGIVINSDHTVAESEPVSDKGSTFTGYASTVQSSEDVSTVLSQLGSDPAVAARTHRIYAYRYKINKTIHENYDSDGDHGIGLKMLRVMQEQQITNCIWIVTRDCSPGFSHIGQRRFEHAISVCQSATSQLKDE